jgi:glycosyltransferase involved in cell wall biosynthesis
MRILILNWQDIKNPQAGGAEVHLHEIFSRVAGLGHEVTLFCSSFPGAPARETIDGIRVVREGGRYFFNFRVFFRYVTRLRKERYDVVIEDMNKIPFFTPLYVRRPLHFIIHHLFDRSIFLETSFPIALYVYLLERAAVSLLRSRQISTFVVSPSTREEMLAKGLREGQMEIVNNCVDHARYTPDPSRRSTTPLIGYFGRLKKYKAVDHLLLAFARLAAERPDLRLVVIGEGDHRPALEALARSLGIEAQVTFTGFVSETEKVAWLRRVWFLANTSSKEGWGLTVIEANACGVPVVASDVPGLRDAVRDGETGLLYPFGDVEKLTANIRLLLEDGQLRNRLGAAAQEWAATFDWGLVARKTAGLLEKSLRREP